MERELLNATLFIIKGICKTVGWCGLILLYILVLVLDNDCDINSNSNININRDKI